MGIFTRGPTRTRAWTLEASEAGVDPRVVPTWFGRRALPLGALAIVVGTTLAVAVAYVASGHVTFPAERLVALPVAWYSWWESRRQHPRFLVVFVAWTAVIALPARWMGPDTSLALVVPLVMVAMLGGLVLDRSRTYVFFGAVLAAWAVLVRNLVGRPVPGEELGRVVAIQGVGIVVALLLVIVMKRVMVGSIQRYVELFDTVPIGLYRSTPDGRILAANQKLADMLGYERVTDLLEVDARSLYVDPGVRDEVLAASEDEADDLHFQLRRRDGRAIWVRETNRAVRGDDGTVTHYEGAIEDVTDRIRAEQSAARAQRVFAVSFESAPIGMALVGPDGRFLRVNRAFCELFRRSAKSFARLSVDNVLKPVDGPEQRPVLPLGAGSSTEIERKLSAADGTEFWGRISLSSVPADAVREAFMVLQVSDVSAQRRLQQHLEDLVRAKDEFIASVSHEIRTPLTAVMGFASELVANAGRYTSEELSDLLEVVAEQARSVSHIVEDLLVAARADIGRLVVDPRPIDVQEEIARAVLDCEHQRREQGAQVELGGDEVQAVADPGRVRQVVRNLLTNAYRYGGSSVRVAVTNGGGTVHILVSDDGDGVPPTKRTTIFEPYQRAHDRDGAIGSIGLGLAVSKKLARLMGGDLVYRYEEGRSVFDLALPAG